MQVDLERWHSLQKELLALSAQHRGFGQTIFEMEQQWSKAEAARLRAVNDYQRLAGGKRDVAAAAEEALAAATEITASLDDKLTALRRQQETLLRRSGVLQELSRRCRTWAKTNNIGLPGVEDDGITGTLSPVRTHSREFWQVPGAGATPELAAAAQAPRAAEAASPSNPIGRLREYFR